MHFQFLFLIAIEFQTLDSIEVERNSNKIPLERGEKVARQRKKERKRKKEIERETEERE